jgi:hypothetical protein
MHRASAVAALLPITVPGRLSSYRRNGKNSLKDLTIAGVICTLFSIKANPMRFQQMFFKPRIDANKFQYFPTP